MKTLEDLDDADAVELGNGYLLCASEVNQRDCTTCSGKKIFGLVVSELQILQVGISVYFLFLESQSRSIFAYIILCILKT